MAENEVCLDLSKKIKFKNNYYISIGTLLISGLIALVQWCITPSWNVVLSFLIALRCESQEN